MNEDAQLERLLSSHRRAFAAHGAAPDDHVDVDTLARHAARQLSTAKARAVTEHLVVCDDGRCPAFVRQQIESAEAASQWLYPARDEHPARERSFQCRELLWETFEQMAHELDVPIDDLLENAMQAYAAQRGHLEVPTGRRPPVDVEETQAREGDPFAQVAAPARAATLPAPALAAEDDDPLGDSEASHGRPLPRAQAAPPAAARAPLPGAAPPWQETLRLGAPAPRPAQPATPIEPYSMRPLEAPRAAAAPPPAPGASLSRPTPPPLPRTAPVAERAAPLGARLTLTYRGEAHPVDVDRYLVGRSKTQADLRLDDPNVSRQHAAIERVNGVWYVVDLGSTNGVYVGGERVARRPLVDGDVIEITTHQIQVSLR